jgi:histidyl-tRNA synthetase
MFRYDRPQKGRWRQFHQINVELIGVSEPEGDVEIIALAAHILEKLGVLGQTTLELNSLGDSASRAAYREVLVEYFSDHRDQLSPDSQERLTRNPLRILDSKDKGDRRVCEAAPLLDQYLNPQSQDFFSKVRQGLGALEIPYRISPHLVRGLDYYTHTIFEFTTEALGAQSSVLGGGRYDGLIELLGGPSTPGVGWAGGIERLAMLLEETPPLAPPIAVVPIGSAADQTALTLTHTLRRAGHAVDLGYSGNTGKRMKRANKLSARAAIILGEDELAQNAATVRDLESGEQELVPLDALSEYLTRFR